MSQSRVPVLSPILFRPGRLTDVADRYTAPCLIIRHGVRLLACLVLLGAVAACGSHWGRAPVNTMAGDAALTEAMVLEKVPTPVLARQPRLYHGPGIERPGWFPQRG